MLRRVLVHISTLETQQVSTKGHFALDYASPEKLVIKISKRCQKSVMDHVVAQSSRRDIVDGSPCGSDTLIQHMRGMVFLMTEHESKEIFRQYCRPGGPLSRQNGESMKWYVSRRRRCWTLLVQMDPRIHVSEGHRSDMLLDLSGLTREERVMVQASISNERDFDRVAEALSHHPTHTYSSQVSQKRAKGKDKEGCKRVDNPNARWFRGKGKGKHTGSGKSGASAHHANLTSVEDYDYYYEDMDETASAHQAHSDPVDNGSDDGEEAPDYDGDEENDTFSSYVALDDVTVFEAAELDEIALLADAWNDDLDTEVSAQLVQASAQGYLSYGKEKGKGQGKSKGKGKGRYPVRPSHLSLEDRRRRLKEQKKRKPSVELAVGRDIGQTIANAQCLPSVRLRKNKHVQIVWRHYSILPTERIRLQCASFFTNTVKILIYPHTWSVKTYLCRQKQLNSCP